MRSHAQIRRPTDARICLLRAFDLRMFMREPA